MLKIRCIGKEYCKSPAPIEPATRHGSAHGANWSGPPIRSTESERDSARSGRCMASLPNNMPRWLLLSRGAAASARKRTADYASITATPPSSSAGCSATSATPASAASTTTSSACARQSPTWNGRAARQW